MHRDNVQMRFGGPLTPIVKRLIIINAAIYVIQLLAGLSSTFDNTIINYFSLHHKGLLYEFKIWQIFTYMFLHGSFLHLLFNLIALWMFGGDLELEWGSKLFLKYYIYSGIGAGIFIAIMNYVSFITYKVSIPTLGASGAIFAILLAYGITWPNRELLLYFIIPVKVKYIVLGYGFISFIGVLTSLTGKGSSISHIGHLGGLISGYIMIMLRNKKFTSPGASNQSDRSVINQALKKNRLKKKKKVIETRIHAKKIIDELLEKIARHGMGSLTEDEKKKLEWARKNYYPENNDILH